MKLKQAVIMGKFCGLETVEECVNNFYLHAHQMMPYRDVPEALEELSMEYHHYKEGILTLDMAEIDDEVARELDNYDDWYNKQGGLV